MGHDLAGFVGGLASGWGDEIRDGVPAGHPGEAGIMHAS
jgi:hypothetical protein